MGSCFGRCVTSKNKRSSRSQRSMYYRASDNVEFDFLVDKEEASRTEARPQLGISYLLSFKKKKRPPREVSMELVDDSWRDSRRFQPLDARSLLARGLMRETSRTSTPASSLDLEWENEGAATQTRCPSAAVTDEESTTRWSRGSTPDSLEWDPAETALGAGLDADTERLLSEIERLTARALRETGDWTS